ncbi:MAG: hydrogenase formation protein HypD [Candidatus Aminicenantes bacterium]|nr:hydrogenase formation protein HypD [Candidatus Aminicenantes bacterium]
MKELRDRAVTRGLLQDIEKKMRQLSRPVRVMEVCGTHTMTVHRYGLKSLLTQTGVEMVTGPGCPVCITPNDTHEACLGLLTEQENLILTSFGDMTRVPTRKGSLQTAIPARSSRLRIVYSPEESLSLARSNPDREVVFFGVGFETTIPSIALTAKKASQEGLKNYSVLTALWLLPPALRAILKAGETAISGFLYPGHVSAIIGVKPYEFIPKEYGVAGAIAGFEPNDVLLGIATVLDQIRDSRPAVANEYRRVVHPSGNPMARAVMEEMLAEKDATWRGLGKIPRSGLELKSAYAAYDARRKFKIKRGEASGDLPGCRCGEILRGLIEPPLCPLYSKECRPESPYGPCMVSLEGACYITYKFGREKPRPSA